jgi:hypothetical protein
MTKKNPNENSDSAFSSEDQGKASEQNDTGFSDDQIQAAIALSLLENNQESKFESVQRSNKGKNPARERFVEEPEQYYYYDPNIHGSSSGAHENHQAFGIDQDTKITGSNRGESLPKERLVEESEQHRNNISSSYMDSLLSDVLGANEHVGLESRGNYPARQSTLHQEADLGFLENYDFDMSEDTNKITLVEEGEKTILIKNEREIILNDDEKGFLYNDILSPEEIWGNRMAQETLPKTTKSHSQNFPNSYFAQSDDEPMAKCGRPRASSDDEPPDLISSSGDEEELSETPSVRKVEKLDSGNNKKSKDDGGGR